MIRNTLTLFFICFLTNLLLSQNDGSTAESRALYPERYISPLDANLHQEEVEVEYFAHQLSQLKDAFADNNSSNIVVRESAVLMALRNEINQLELRLASDAAQAERRKTASNGTMTTESSANQAPARDPLADATTPDEVRFETFQYTLAAFERHSFDPGKPEEAARDFAKLDNVLKIMQDALAELKAIRR